MTIHFPNPAHATQIWEASWPNNGIVITVGIALCFVVALVAIGLVGGCHAAYEQGYRALGMSGAIVTIVVAIGVLVYAQPFHPHPKMMNTTYGRTVAEARTAVGDVHAAVELAPLAGNEKYISTAHMPLNASENREVSAGIEKTFGVKASAASASVTRVSDPSKALAQAQSGTTFTVKGQLMSCALEDALHYNNIGQPTSDDLHALICADGAHGLSLTPIMK